MRLINLSIIYNSLLNEFKYNSISAANQDVKSTPKCNNISVILSQITCNLLNVYDLRKIGKEHRDINWTIGKIYNYTTGTNEGQTSNVIQSFYRLFFITRHCQTLQ